MRSTPAAAVIKDLAVRPSVPTAGRGDDAVQRARRALRTEDQVRPPFAGEDLTGLVCGRLDRSCRGRPHGDDAPAAAPHRIDQRCGLVRYAEPFRQRCLAGLQRRHTGMQRDRRQDDPTRDQFRDQLVRERPSCRRHLGAAGIPAEHGLVRGERPDTAHVPVTDGPSDLRQERRDVVDPVQACRPQATAAGDGRIRIATGQHQLCARERHPLASNGVADALAAGRSQFGNPPGSIRCGAGEMHHDGGAMGPAAVDRSRQRRAGVDDQDVTAGQEPAQVPEQH